MKRIERRIITLTSLPAIVFTIALASPGPTKSNASLASDRFLDDAMFEGSTIASTSALSQPDLIYKKFPTNEPVTPGVAWQLSIGVLLDSTAPSIPVTLSLDPSGQNANVQITSDSATFTEQSGLDNNYDSLERFEILYDGTLDPFLGPIDVLLEPDGFAAIPIRVHLGVTDQTGFPIPLFSFTGPSVPLGDINGNGKKELVVPSDADGQEGLYAFDHLGNLLPGWPVRNEDPDVTDQGFSPPAIVDLDGDGQDEIIAFGFTQRDVTQSGRAVGVETTTTLYAIEGSGAIRWQITDDFMTGSIPAVADIDGDGVQDILMGLGGNLIRIRADGVPLGGWQVDTQADINVRIPVIADLDSDPANGLEIATCAFEFAPQPGARLYVWNADGSLHGSNWPKVVDACIPPTVVDLDHNAANGQEFIFALDHGDDPPVDPDTGFLNTFSVFAWDHNGADVMGWPHHFLRDPNVGFFDDRVIAPCSAGDVDGDGDVEVVVGTYGQGDPDNGNLFVFHHDGTLDANWPQWAGIAQTPSEIGGVALGDLDGDGRAEIVTGSFRGVYVFRSNGQTFDGFPRLTGDNFAQSTSPLWAILPGTAGSRSLDHVAALAIHRNRPQIQHLLMLLIRPDIHNRLLTVTGVCNAEDIEKPTTAAQINFNAVEPGGMDKGLSRELRPPYRTG